MGSEQQAEQRRVVTMPSRNQERYNDFSIFWLEGFSSHSFDVTEK
jgi:hypothetical protein